MLKLKKENKKKVLVILVVVAFISFLVKNKIKLVTEVTSLIFNPIQSKIYKTEGNIENFGKGILNFKELVKENNDNRAKVALLETEAHLYRNLQSENERLKKLLEIKNERPDLKIGIVIFRHIYDLYKNFTINLGEEEKIKKNMVAVIGNNLVGKVVSVSQDHSIVETINSEDFNISVINDLQVLGIVKGNEDDPRKLIFIPSVSDENVNIGDTIYTSGVSDVYPKGLIVGKIISKSKEEEMFSVEPSVDVSKLTEVIIIGKGVE
ncbi:MAG: rod shape-determining protein MreC [Fusobacteriaceae bacterium]